jgi:hypothetical protein
VDRGGRIKRVEFYAGKTLMGADDTGPYTFTWDKASPGCYDITAVAVDDANQSTTSNNVRIGVGMVNLALGKNVAASSGEASQNAVDGNYYSTWASAKNDDEWIYVDLGRVYNISPSIFCGAGKYMPRTTLSTWLPRIPMRRLIGPPFILKPTILILRGKPHTESLLRQLLPGTSACTPQSALGDKRGAVISLRRSKFPFFREMPAVRVRFDREANFSADGD